MTMEVQDLTCPICLCVAEDPQVSSCCARVFCAEHADTSQYQNGCPLCRARNFRFTPSVRHKTMLDKLTIQCACSEHVAPDDYDNHLSRCSSATFTCPHTACREKNNSKLYNSQTLVKHLARSHCNEVPLLGTTYIKKDSVAAEHQAANKYENLNATLQSVLFPKMIDTGLKNASSDKHGSAALKCSQGHELVRSDHSQRRRRNGTPYSSMGFNCDICHRSFTNGQSWHCSNHTGGFDKCITCFVFQLYNLDNRSLNLAEEGMDEDYSGLSRRRNTDLTHSISRPLNFLAEDMDDEYDEELDVNLMRRNLIRSFLQRYRNSTEPRHEDTNREED